jgi:ketosteroid isomerase-like protein
MMPLTEQQVVGLLDKSVSAFNAKKPEYFDAFAHDVVVFVPDRTDPVKGVDAFKEQFKTLITGDSEEKVQGRTVQILGDKAVVTQNVQLMLANSTMNLRQTLIVGDSPNGPQIVHFQSSPITPAKNLPAVSVVNNKIATVAPVLGVAQ